MFKRILAILIATFFLLASTLLPKGDFALMADLPAMYQHYTQIDDPKDIGIADFVVDYLLNAEGIFGADLYKGHPVPYNTVQFQHGANFISYLPVFGKFNKVYRPVVVNRHYVTNDAIVPSAYINKLLRPPVSC